MRMRDSNSRDTPQRLHRGHSYVIKQGDTIPQHVAGGRAQDECTLADCKGRLGADGHLTREIIQVMPEHSIRDKANILSVGDISRPPQVGDGFPLSDFRLVQTVFRVAFGFRAGIVLVLLALCRRSDDLSRFGFGSLLLIEL